MHGESLIYVVLLAYLIYVILLVYAYLCYSASLFYREDLP